MKKLKSQTGFTLIELIVVLAVLATLSAIVVPRYIKNLENAHIATHNANVRTIIATATIYQIENDHSVSDITDLPPEYLDAIPAIPRGLSDYITAEDYLSGYQIEAGDTFFGVTPGLIE